MDLIILLRTLDILKSVAPREHLYLAVATFPRSAGGTTHYTRKVIYIRTRSECVVRVGRTGGALDHAPRTPSTREVIGRRWTFCVG